MLEGHRGEPGIAPAHNDMSNIMHIDVVIAVAVSPKNSAGASVIEIVTESSNPAGHCICIDGKGPEHQIMGKYKGVGCL